MAMKTDHPSSLGLIILSMLVEAPMHAYRMQKLIRDRGKDKVVNVRQRTSIHQTLERLRRMGLIQVQNTLKSDDGRPDRTVYEITPDGRSAANDWLGRMLTTISPEFPDFPAAVSVQERLTCVALAATAVNPVGAVGTGVAGGIGVRPAIVKGEVLHGV